MRSKKILKKFQRILKFKNNFKETPKVGEKFRKNFGIFEQEKNLEKIKEKLMSLEKLQKNYRKIPQVGAFL